MRPRTFLRSGSPSGWFSTALLLLALITLLVTPAAAHPRFPSESPGSLSLAPTAPTPNLVTNITYGTPSPNILHLNQNIAVTFNYQTNEPGGVRIFARPFTAGALTPNYAASGSPLYPTGSGTGSGSFTITSGSVNVDQIRFQILSADQSRLLFEGFVPVYYHFASSVDDLSSIGLSPMTPNILANNQNVTVSFSYETGQAGGVRIFARPFTAGALTPNYAASGSPLYPTGSGTGSGSFTITSGSVNVDQIRFQILSADQSRLLFESLVPVHYQFGVVKQIYLPLVIR